MPPRPALTALRSTSLLSSIASYVYRQTFDSTGARQYIFSALRSALIRLTDPTCRMTVHDRDILLPLSHALPTYLAAFPLYDRLPGRIAAYLRTTRSNIRFIDVGANVGDTAAAIVSTPTDRLLAIEPHPLYFAYLQANWARQSNTTLLNVGCAAETSTSDLTLAAHAGTATLVNSPGTSISLYALDDLLLEHQDHATPDFLKLDTDGYDLAVLKGASNLLAAVHPILLFECAPFDSRNYTAECLDTLVQLAAYGYSTVLAYNNFGNLMFYFSPARPETFEALLFYQLTSPFYYYDLLVLPPDHAERFTASELHFFATTQSASNDREAAMSSAQRLSRYHHSWLTQ